MKTWKTILAAAAAGAVFCAALHFSLSKSSFFPAPTNGEIAGHQEEGEENHEKREAWFELMHSAAEGTDWRRVEYENDRRRHLQRRQVRARGGEETLADGWITGQWKERGSKNQAGSVINTLYDPATDEIYLISDGGTLYRGKRDGSDWTPIQQDLRFNAGLLEWIPTPQGRRMLAFIGRIPHYSDDDGLSWTPAQGISHDDRWGNFHAPVLAPDSSHVYVLAKKDYWSNIRLYRSTDQGETYEFIQVFTTSDFNRIKLCRPHGSNEVYLLRGRQQETELYRIDQADGSLELLSENSDFLLGEARANLAGFQAGTLTRLYAYNEVEDVHGWYFTEDFGQTWIKQGNLPERPWRVGVYISPSDPDFMLLGEVECFRSFDGGQSWTRINHWWEYYGDVPNMLHADMMHFAEFETADGTPFLLISNHGGLSISYDQSLNNENIGMEGLNVSQYYSVRSPLREPDLFFAGSQDQGFQRGFVLGQGPQNMTQLISGDYGHIVFSGEEDRLWTVYPGGWVTVYADISDDAATDDWSMDSENESVWLPPLHELADPNEDAILMAGGNAFGEEGSYLVRLDYLPAQQQIGASQYPFDFLEASGGEVSAIEVSKEIPGRIYVATTNGRFFTSDDGGQSWEQTVNFLPSGHYLYGQSILASKKYPERVFLGGSGYNNPPVWISEDGGQTFVQLSNGLPSTLVFDLCLDPAEEFLYAATEAGPYVYVFEEEQWVRSLRAGRSGSDLLVGAILAG